MDTHRENVNRRGLIMCMMTAWIPSKSGMLASARCSEAFIVQGQFPISTDPACLVPCACTHTKMTASYSLTHHSRIHVPSCRTLRVAWTFSGFGICERYRVCCWAPVPCETRPAFPACFVGSAGPVGRGMLPGSSKFHAECCAVRFQKQYFQRGRQYHQQYKVGMWYK